MGNFFAELKRRNVYKVAVAYAIVGWLLVQVATQVFPFFEIPNWAVRLIVLAIIISSAVQLPFVFVRLQGATNFEQMQTTLQNLTSARPPEPLMLAAYATSALVHAVIRPLLGIAFVVLYFDAKSGHHENKI